MTAVADSDPAHRMTIRWTGEPLTMDEGLEVVHLFERMGRRSVIATSTDDDGSNPIDG